MMANGRKWRDDLVVWAMADTFRVGAKLDSARSANNLGYTDQCDRQLEEALRLMDLMSSRVRLLRRDLAAETEGK